LFRQQINGCVVKPSFDLLCVVFALLRTVINKTRKTSQYRSSADLPQSDLLVYPSMSESDGEAVDVVCVYGEEIYTTEFHVKFSRPSIQINLFGSAPAPSEEDLQVKVSCNGHFCPNVFALMNFSTRLVEFIDNDGNTNFPTSEVLRNLGLLRGKNVVLFECTCFKLKAECSVFLWSVTDRVVVVDIDGTLTKSDVRGYVETVYMGRYDYVHEGAVSYFSSLEEDYGVCILYLTSRPLHHLSDTRAFLRLVHTPRGSFLPVGPLFTNRETVLRAVYRELWAKTTAQFKGGVLVDVLSVFAAAGSSRAPFCMGVGNKETDAVAYQMAGLMPSSIMLVQKTSQIRVESKNFLGDGALVQTGDSLPPSELEAEDAAQVRALVFTNYADSSLMEYTHRTLVAAGLTSKKHLAHNFQQSKMSRSSSFKSSSDSRDHVSSSADANDGDDDTFFSRGLPSAASANDVDMIISPDNMPPPQPSLPLSRGKSDSSSAPSEPKPKPPPVDFRRDVKPAKAKAASSPGGLKSSTDFFNPHESADI
jgi:hypothetical protein